MTSTARFPDDRSVASPAWLERSLDAPWLRVVDVRTDLGARSDASSSRLRGSDADPPRFVELGAGTGWMRAGRWAPQAKPPECFLAGHVPGASSLDVARRLFDRTGSVVSAPELAMAMSELGVGDEHTVVLVDDGATPVSLVAAWALRRYGHAEVRVLEGGFRRWAAEQRPVSRDVVRHVFASFTARVSR